MLFPQPDLARGHVSRRGVTLLEVLISIGVTAIGILGVMSLIPLAGSQARKGQIAERSIVIGLAGVGELQTRGMLNPNNWIDAAGNTNSNGYFVSPGALRPICIDGRRVAYDGAVQFPAFGTTSATPFTAMSRVTLRSHLPANTAITKLMADYIFQSQDDLTLVLPSDRSMPPVNLLTGGSTTPTRRQFEGSMSWMVTLVPKVGAYNSDNSDLYTASIVVFHSRPFDDKAERLAVVTSFPGAGIAGGDVSLTADDGLELDIQTNQWIMLSGQTPSTPYYRWYRVLGTDTVKGSPTANVTLQGPDWNPSIPAQATIMPGVVAVYEKTVRLETSSLWNN